MANSDYQVTGTGGFATNGQLSAAVGRLDTRLYLMNGRLTGVPILVGDGVMADNEIMRITVVGNGYVDVARGCYDTIPEPHEVGVTVWFWKQAVGADRRVYAAGENIGVKILPYTPGGGTMRKQNSPPQGLTFDFRFIRPYPPGDFQINAVPWFEFNAAIEDADLVLTWAQRNRLTQADQLISHDDGNITPEAGTTYRLRLYRANVPGLVVATRDGITGATFTYTLAMALEDFDFYDTIEEQEVIATLHAVRDDYESLNGYSFTFNVTQPYGLGYRLGTSLGGIAP